MDLFVKDQIHSLIAKGTYKQVGQEIQGVAADFKITEGSLIAAGHRHGPTGLQTYLKVEKAHNYNRKVNQLTHEDEKDLHDVKGKTTPEQFMNEVETRLRKFGEEKKQ